MRRRGYGSREKEGGWADRGGERRGEGIVKGEAGRRGERCEEIGEERGGEWGRGKE